MSDSEPQETTSTGRVNLPLRFRIGVIGLFAIAAVVHIFVDAFSKSYEGAGTSFMLVGFVGTAVAGNEVLSRAGK